MAKAKPRKVLSRVERVHRVLSACGQPTGKAEGFYRERIEDLSKLCDAKGNVAPNARAEWMRIHSEIAAEHKATDEITDKEG